MGIKTLAEFRLLYRNGAEKTFAAGFLKDAAALNETEENRLSQVTLVKSDIEVDVPEIPLEVRFVSEVSPQGAFDGGCRATPTGYKLFSGARTVFQALPAAGFNFTGWYKDGVFLSADTVTELAISPPGEGEVTAVYEAKFEPA
jgi:uncharacterized repeat protein (TIGR02543 family)